MEDKAYTVTSWSLLYEIGGINGRVKLIKLEDAERAKVEAYEQGVNDMKEKADLIISTLTKNN